MRKIVVPGEKITGKVLANVYREGDENYSMVLGLLDKEDDIGRIIQLGGKYLPNEGDYVVGVVVDVKFGGYTVEINSPYSAFLPSQREYDYFDVVSAKIQEVDEVKNVVLGEERKLIEGETIEISPVKVPRVIGKKGSMLALLREKTGCDIFVGKNGRIWIRGEKAIKAKQTILKIEAEAHSDGLTDRIKEFLEKGD